MLRVLQSIAIVGFFLFMMTLLVRDHIIPNMSRGTGIDVDYRVLADSWTNQDEWMEIRLGEMPLGALRTVTEYHSEENAYFIAGHMEIRTPLVSGRLLTAANLNSRLELLSARLLATMPGFGSEIPAAETIDAEELPSGVFELLGAVRGGAINMRLQRDGNLKFISQPLTRPVTMADSITPLLRGDLLSENVIYSIDIYDPLLGGNSGRTEIEWVSTSSRIGPDGEEERLRIVEMRVGGSKTTLTVDDDGTVLRREIPLILPAGSGAGADSAPRLILVRLDQRELQERFPGLQYIPERPTVRTADVTGEDRGEVFEGVNLMSLIGGGLRDRMRPAQGQN